MSLLLQIEITHLQAGIIFGAVLGAVVGLIPLILGIIKKNLKVGALGFIGSIIGSAILGLILAIPVAGVAVYLIIKGKGESTDGGIADEASVDLKVGED